MQLQRVAVGFRQLDGIGEGQPSVLSCELEELLIENGQRRHQLFPFDLIRQRVFLFDQAQQKKTKPVHQVRLVTVQRSLGASQSAIVLLAVFLNDTFQRTVGHVAVAGPKQKQIGQNAASLPLPSWNGWMARYRTINTATTSR